MVLFKSISIQARLPFVRYIAALIGESVSDDATFRLIYVAGRISHGKADSTQRDSVRSLLAVFLPCLASTEQSSQIRFS